MTETEKAYIAGIIDGEGSVMLQRIHKNEHPSPCVSIASTTLTNIAPRVLVGSFATHFLLARGSCEAQRGPLSLHHH
ncbi:hypothetical protein [Clostridium sp.]|uniref:hypothetical protein n=1 Tax=Clostridium sp. TaxID=1506 RepID=UPI0025BC701E|nr:hypothetical protein [Clostridium sp.]